MLQGWTLSFNVFFLPILAFSSSLSPNIQQLEKSDEIIRVKLGIFRLVQVNGFDIMVNTRARMLDHRKITISCENRNHGGEVRLGSMGVYSSPVVLEGRDVLYVNEEAYRRKIIIHAQNNQCLVVNELGIEQYVAGVINNEMQGNWPLEALKAQAIAARSYAIYEAQHAENALFHVESTTKDQMYGGANTESFRANLATKSTRGTVLYFESDVFKAYYHSNCGGRTDLPEFVWGNKPGSPYKSVYCPYHYKETNNRRWSLILDKIQLEAAVRRVAGLLPQGFHRLASLTSGSLTPGNRYKTLVAIDSSGQRAEIPANLLRQSVGFTRLKSTKFDFQLSGNKVEFKGRGFGHGVGMCQYGAKEMALHGKDYISILKFYYPLARLANLY